jgi:hypothetical protein
VHCPGSSHGDDVDRPNNLDPSQTEQKNSNRCRLRGPAPIHPSFGLPQGINHQHQKKKEDSHQKNPPERRSGLARTPYQDQKPETTKWSGIRTPSSPRLNLEPGAHDDDDESIAGGATKRRRPFVSHGRGWAGPCEKPCPWFHEEKKQIAKKNGGARRSAPPPPPGLGAPSVFSGIEPKAVSASRPVIVALIRSVCGLALLGVSGLECMAGARGLNLSLQVSPEGEEGSLKIGDRKDVSEGIRGTP